MLAGAIDASSRLFWVRKIGSFGYQDSWQKEETDQIVGWIKQNSSENDIFLTAPSIAPLPLFYAGRPIYIGFEGWLWTQGADYSSKKQKLEEIISGNIETACREKIRFILFDSELLQSFQNTINKNAILESSSEVFSQQMPDGTQRKILEINCGQKDI